MTDTTPAAELLAAAEKLRSLATAVPTEDWGTRPWHVEECSDTDTMESCPCIVAQGEYKEFDQPQIPPVQYVADAETREHAEYIAAMHPGVGLALADWLENMARTVDAVADKYEPDPGSHWLAPALAVARQVLGTTT
jgi:hypothetical protein